MGATTVFSLLVLWMTLLPLEGRTIGSQLRADRSSPAQYQDSSSPDAQYQAAADAVVADLQKLASAKLSSSREAAVDLLHHFSQSPKRRAFDNSPPHRSSKRAVFDILPHRLRVEEEAQTSSRLVRSFNSSRILKVEVANQSKLKNLIKKLIRKYILIKKIKLLRNGRRAESSVLPHHTTSSSISM